MGSRVIIRVFFFFSFQELGQILCISGQDGKEKLGSLIRIAAEIIDFYFFAMLLITPLKNALHFPQTFSL